MLFFFGKIDIAYSQQIGLFSHYFYKPLFYNPAFTGYKDETDAMLISRSQWAEFKNPPQLTVFTIDGNLFKKKVCLGLGFSSDRKGITNRISGTLYYAYRLILNDDTRILFGLSFGVLDHTIDFSKAQAESSIDPTLFNYSLHKTSFDGSAGIAFISKGLELGLSVPQILGNKLNYVDTSNLRANYTQARHFMTSVKYKIFINKEKEISIAPQGLVRFLPQAPFQFDGNINIDWKDKFWIGTTYKSNYAIAANVGFCIHKQFYLGYSYDFITGFIGKYSGISHEIMINFKFIKKNSQEDAVIAKSANEDKIDDLKNQLEENQNKIKVLNEKIKKSTTKELVNIEKGEGEVEEGEEEGEEEKGLTETEVNPKQQTDENKIKVLNEKIKKSTTKELVNIEKGEGEEGEEKEEKGLTETEVNPKQQTDELKPGIPDEDGVFVIKKSDFKDSKNRIPDKGFYVIVGIFFYRDFAAEEVKKFVKRGFTNTNWLFSESKKNNYIYTQKVENKEAALQKVKEVNSSGAKNAWVLKLID